MNFLRYNGYVLLSGLGTAFLVSIGLMILLSLLAAIRRRGPASYAFLALADALQVYALGLWVAVCVATTYWFAAKQEVTWDWLYFACGFIWCSGLSGWLSYRRGRSAKRHPESPTAPRGSAIYWAVASVAYVLFALWPWLMRFPYGWVLNLLNLPGGGRFEIPDLGMWPL